MKLQAKEALDLIKKDVKNAGGRYSDWHIGITRDRESAESTVPQRASYNICEMEDQRSAVSVFVIMRDIYGMNDGYEGCGGDSLCVFYYTTKTSVVEIFHGTSDSEDAEGLQKQA